MYYAIDNIIKIILFPWSSMIMDDVTVPVPAGH